MANSSCMFRTTTEASCAKYWMEFISLSCRHFKVLYRFCFDTLVRSSHTMLCSAFLPSSTRHSLKKRNATEYFESTQCLRNTTWEWKRRSWRNSVYKQLPLYEIKWESINRVFSTRNRTNLIFSPSQQLRRSFTYIGCIVTTHTTHSHHISFFQKFNFYGSLSVSVCFDCVKFRVIFRKKKNRSSRVHFS